jgi:hypothetical protein
MNRKTLSLAALLTAAASMYACIQDSDPSELAASSAAAIEGGQVINSLGDPVAVQFPRSTVRLVTTHKNGDGGLGQFSCTGIIITPTQILTAAHCKTNSTTQVYFYPSGAGLSDVPTGTPLTPAATSANGGPNPAVQPGIDCAHGASNDTCYTSTPSYHFADIAILTLSATVPDGHEPVALGAAGAMESTISRSSWEVGTGMMNQKASGACSQAMADPTVSNDKGEMKWVTASTFSTTDIVGYFSTRSVFGDSGDSGGPLYQLAPGQVATGSSDASTGSLPKLILLGVLAKAGCAAAGGNLFTSVEHRDNHAWIVGQMVTTPAPNLVVPSAAQEAAQ